MEVDLLILGGWVLCINKKDYKEGGVAVKDGRIIEVNTRKTIEKRYKAKKTIDKRDSIILPGFINCHTHLPMVYFRGLADDLPLNDWLKKYIWPSEALYVRRRFVKNATQLGVCELIKSGTTTFSDMYFFEDEVAKVVREAGVRGILGEGILSFPTPFIKEPKNSIKRVEKFIKDWLGDDFIIPCVAPHSIYTCSKGLLKEAKRLADRYGLRYHIHISETENEVSKIKRKEGTTPVGYLEKMGVLDENVMAVHSVWLTDEDIEILKMRRVGVVDCPQSNMKLASGVAPIPKILKHRIKIGMGTDGAASNNNLDLIDEARSAALLHKVYSNNPAVLKAREVVKMLTLGGAEVLGLEAQIGSLEKGKRADIIIVDIKKPHLLPLYDPYSHLIYSASGSDVETVIINGRVVMENRKILTLDEEGILEKAKRFRIKFSKVLI